LKPEIGAIGFFKIGLHLIPTVCFSRVVLLLTLAQTAQSNIKFYLFAGAACQLVGTSLTYILIMLQFYLAEKS